MVPAMDTALLGDLLVCVCICGTSALEFSLKIKKTPASVLPQDIRGSFTRASTREGFYPPQVIVQGRGFCLHISCV